MEKLDPTPVRAMAFVQLQLSQVLHKQGQQRSERSEGKNRKKKRMKSKEYDIGNSDLLLQS